MKIVYLATSQFAVPILEGLVQSNHDIVHVITQPQKQKGRGLKVLPHPIEEAASRLGLKVQKFPDINSKKGVDFLKKQEADLFVVVSFGQILSAEVLAIPKLYPINVHASLLPKYRGAGPIQWAIIKGEKETGITIMRVTELLDHGDIIAQASIEIGEDENSESLEKRLAGLGAKLLNSTLWDIEQEGIVFVPQDDSAASYAPKLKKQNGLIDWSKDALSIKNLIQGCYPWPSAFTYWNKRLLKVLEAGTETEVEGECPGSVIRADKQGVLVSTGNGSVLIKKLQLAGKNPLVVAEFLRGNPISPETILGQTRQTPEDF